MGVINSGTGVLTVCINITHTYDNDLTISLVSPDGTTIDLSATNGGSSDNYTNTCFSMTASTSITAGTAPFTGSFLPEPGSSFTSFNNGQNADGTWQLCVSDGVGGDIGTLNSWSITFGGQPVNPLDTLTGGVAECPILVADSSAIHLGCGVQCATLTASLPDISNTNTYKVDSTNISYSDHYPFTITGATQIFVNQDDIFSDAVSLPFNFCFYGQTYTKAVIGANGLITFNDAYANAYCPWNTSSYGTIPNTSYAMPAIFAAYHDMDPSIASSSPKIEYILVGTAPCRQLVVNFTNVSQYNASYCSGLKSTLQVILYENTNVIDVFIKDKPVCTAWNSGKAIMGLQNASGTVATVVPGKNNTLWGTTNYNKAYRFIPDGASLLNNVTVYKDGVSVGTATITNGPNGELNATYNSACVTTPGDTATFVMQANYTSCSGVLLAPIDTVVVYSTPGPTPPVAPSPIQYCQGATATPLTPNGAGYLWYPTPTGGAGVSSITPSTATVGSTSYYVSRVVGGCESFRDTVVVNVVASSSATISYAGSPYCTSTGTAGVTLTGSATGVFSASSTNLTINAGTGAITPSSSTPGTYTVTYSIAAGGGCPAFSTTAGVTIINAPGATISYSGSPYCSSGGTASVTQTGTTGGTYSNSTGLSINATTGVINLAGSTAGTHTVTYTVAASGGCPAFSTTAAIIINAAPNAGISYAGSPYCSSAGPAGVTLTGTTGGVYASTAGLSIDASTGAITPSTSTAGTYTVTYTVAAANGCPAFSTTASVTINTAPVATIAYATNPYCSNEGTAAVTLTGTTGGAYSSTPGLVINASTGAVNLGASTAGTYTVTYAVTVNGCAAFSTTTSITITTAPNATISYAGSPYCNNGGTAAVTFTGTTGGAYSSTAGLIINASTGAVDLAASTAGSYTVTYTVLASGGCPQYTTTASITINTAPSAGISYTGAFCQTSPGTVAPTITGDAGGTFSVAPAIGLSLNAATGVITPGTSLTGSYTITYSLPANGACAAFQTTTTVTITTSPSAVIAYSGTPYCSNEGTATVTITGSTGGTYSASSANLIINSGTGAVDLAASTAGTYTVTYNIPAASGCAAFSTTTTITIQAAPAATISYVGTPYCKNGGTAAVTQTGTSGGIYTASPAGLIINSSTGLVDLNTSLAGSYTVSYAIGAGPACASVVATTPIVVNPTATSVATQTICQGGSYAFGGTTYTAAGVYINTFATTTGCDSVVTLTLTVTPAIATTITQTICNGDSYAFSGTTYSASGTYLDTLTAASGCDSIVTLTLTVRNAITGTQSGVICQGDVYAFGGNSYSTAGTYTDTFASYTGCDSVVTLNLTVNPTSTSTVNAAICQGDSYTFVANGQSYSTAGTYTGTLQNSASCDSVVTLNLTVNPTYNTATSQTLCAGQSMTWDGVAYSASGSYPGTFQTTLGCDSNVTLNLTVSPAITTTITDTVCNGGSYTFNGTTYTATGTYLDTLTAVAGCDSVVTLNLTVRSAITGTQAGVICQGDVYAFGGNSYGSAGTYVVNFISATGCDSVVTLTLAVNPIYNTTTSQTICAGMSVVWDGVTYSATGLYPGTFQTTLGCDSNVALNLTVNPASASTVNATICQGDSYTFAANSQSYSAAGTYTATLQNSTGCDSIVTLNLSVNPTYNTSVSQSICAGQSVVWDGVTYSASGAYPGTFQTTLGCDSIVTLNLTVSPGITGAVAGVICQGDSYAFGGNSYSAAGTYLDTFSAAGGCDSVVTLTLTVNPTYNTSVSQTVCSGQSVTWDGVTYSASGSYPGTFQTTLGCDSNVTLNLTVNPVSASTVNATICQGDSYTFAANGQSYSAAGTYTGTLQNSNSCDSVVTLNLSVNPTYNTATSQTICPGQSVVWDGVSYSASGAYPGTFQTTLGCDSNVTLNLTVSPAITTTITDTVCNGGSYAFNGATYSATGTYADTLIAAAGCDSIVTLNLTVRPAITGTQAGVICQGDAYAFGGMSYGTAGTYVDTFASYTGCDSVVTLTLAVNPTYNQTVNATINEGDVYVFNGASYTTAGTYPANLQTTLGCDSSVTLVLTVNPTTTGTINAAICQGDSYNFDGTAITAAGTYLDTLVGYTGADSIVTLNLTLNPTYNQTIAAQICQGDAYAFNGNSYTASGSYPANLQTTLGCDSIVTLNLTVNPTSTTAVNAAICQGSSYTFAANGQSYSAAGTYAATLQNSNGCDSVVTLNLTVNPIYNTATSQTICAGQSVTWDGVTYSASGSYPGTFQTTLGCDSNVTLNLTVLPALATTVNAAICQGQTYTFAANGVDYTAAGTYTATLPASTNCDSVVTLHLAVNPQLSSSLAITLCEGQSYAFNGQSLTTAGTYKDTLSSAATGCDSVVTLTLTVNPTYETALNQTICQGSSYTFLGQPLTASGVYADTLNTVLGCDSVISLTLTVIPNSSGVINPFVCQGSAYLLNGQNLTVSGTYYDTVQNVAGCDSFLTIHLTVVPPVVQQVYDTLCYGQTTTFNGTQYNATGVYTDTFATALLGCDSIIVYNLLIRDLVPPPSGSDTAYFCQGTPATPLSGFVTATVLPGTLVWYTQPTGTSSIAMPTPPTNIPNTITYYVAQIGPGGCIGDRRPLTVIVKPKPLAPLVVSPYILCQYSAADSIVALVSADGTLSFYDSLTGGALYVPNPYIDPAVPDTNRYFVSQTVNGCTSVRDTIVVIVNPKPPTPGTDSFRSYCQFETAQPLSATGTVAGAMVMWYSQPTGGVGNPAPALPGTNVPGTTTYYVGQILNGCESDRTPLIVEVRAKPAPPTVVSPLKLCQGSGLIALQASGDNLLWYDGPTGGSGLTDVPIVNTAFAESGEWYVTQTQNGCESDRSLLAYEVNIRPVAAFSIGREIPVICQYDTLNITFTGIGDTTMSYYWSFGDSSVILSGAGMGPYVVYYPTPGGRTLYLVVENRGCVSPIYEVPLTVRPAPSASFHLPEHACVGQLVTIALNYASYGAATYAWDFDGAQIVFGEQGGPFGVVWNVPDTGKQYVTSRAIKDGCYSLPMRDSIVIHDYPVANILTDPNEICAYDTVTLIAEQNALGTAASYVWGPPERVVDESVPGTASIIIPGKASGFSGVVTLAVTTPWGCSSYDSAYVATRSCCEVGVPDAFSPNGDGRNDKFRLITEGRQQIEVFRILNRWGQVIFETADGRQGWDGTYNGRPQDIGTYMFYARYRCSDGTLSEKQGDLTLVR